MSNPWIFQTRELGPNAKGSALTIDELDNSLLYLSASLSGIDSGSIANLSQSVVELTTEVLLLSQSINEIEFHPLSGSNYIFVEANGTPIQNGNYLTASYNLAKTTNPTATNRFSVLLGPGKYEFANNFVIDTEYIDVVSLTGDKDIYITGSNTVVVGANNVYVKGIDVGNNNFTITSSFPNTIFKNCKGGDESFGGSPVPQQGLPASPGYNIASTFIDCEGGNRSFAGYGLAYGIFINCIGGTESFGNYCDGTFKNCVGGNNSFATLANIQSTSIFENCIGGDNSFASAGTIDAGSKVKECVGGINSFGSLGTINGLIENCQVTTGIFSPLLIGATGQMVNCFGPNQTPQNQP
jgi:hypothetical protein